MSATAPAVVSSFKNNRESESKLSGGPLVDAADSTNRAQSTHQTQSEQRKPRSHARSSAIAAEVASSAPRDRVSVSERRRSLSSCDGIHQ